MRWLRRAGLAAGMSFTAISASWGQSCNIANGSVAAATIGNAQSCHGNDGANTGYNVSAPSGGGTDAVSFTNNLAASETFQGVGVTPQQPVFLFSTGGNGGNVAPKTNSNGSIDYDGNGNLQYGDGSGGQGAPGNVVSLTNNGAVSLTTNGGPYNGGAYLVEGLSAGGLGGSGSFGANGGTAASVTVSDSGNATLNWTWTASSQANIGLADVAALSQGGNGNQSLRSGYTGGAGGNADNATLNILPGATLSIAEANYDSNSYPFFGIPGAPSQLIGAAALALTKGGGGGRGYDTSPGGAGGNAYSAVANVSGAAISINSPANALTDQDDGTIAGVLAVSQGGLGGSGGMQQNHDAGGPGGQAGSAMASFSGTRAQPASVFTNGYVAAGVIVASAGGNGGGGTFYTNYAFNSYGGDGGNGAAAGDSAATLGKYSTIETQGEFSTGLAVSSKGGDGGQGGDSDYAFGDVNGFGGNGGAGADAGMVNVSLTGNAGITTDAEGSIGIYAQSEGGAGGNSGSADDFEYTASGDAGDGGNAGNVTISLGTGSTVTTKSTDSTALLAQSFSGGGGGVGSAGSIDANSGSPGAGGNAGNVKVTNSGKIDTTGDDSRGIFAQSSAGAGGTTGMTGGILTHSQTGGAGGNVGTVSVINAGSITTAGASAYGVEAQAIGGGGGGGNSNTSAFQIGGNNGGAGASNGGTATAENSGTIGTTGDNAGAILVQAIGGGGGDGGSSGLIQSIGGTGGSGGTGGIASITGDAGSAITTTGDLGFGLMAQSIGGGGGTGGNVLTQSLIFSIGIAGSGGGGGSANTSTIDSDGSIATTGERADGIVAQSIGGGGGSGGNATAQDLDIGVAVAVGGAGGGGGDGNTATVNAGSGSNIQVAGTDSSGIVAESVGGGGGMGGNGIGQSGGLLFTAAVAVGGSGGMGGAGEAASVNLAGTSIGTGLSINTIPAIPAPADDTLPGTATAAADPSDPATNPDYYEPLPTDSYGVVAQSVGGGGGMGGSGMAQAFTIDVPVPDTDSSFGVSSATGVGGDGKVGGNGGAATVTLSDGTSILTNGNGSHGVVAQSVGGGGGTGGDASAQSSTFGLKDFSTIAGRFNFNLDLTVTNGGGGGGGGAGGDVTVVDGGTALGVADPTSDAPVSIATYGDDADAIYAESIGGGGGAAGFGSGSTQNFTSAATALTATISVGSAGGTGGAGGNVDVEIDPGADITTYGSSSDAIYAHSIGGGGGASQGGSYSFGLPSINTVLKAVGVQGPSLLAGFASANSITITAGETGGAAGNGGNVTVNDEGAYPAYTTITTHSDDASGIYAQSVGGGGGLAGSAGSDGSSDNPYLSAAGAKKLVDQTTTFIKNLIKGLNEIDGASAATQEAINLEIDKALGGASLRTFLPKVTLHLAFGADGGAGGNGGQVDIDLNTAKVTTLGDYAVGLVGQSIGGGGGGGGEAIAGGATGLGALLNINLNFALGGGGGSGGTGGPVTFTLGNNVISTSGFAAYGLLGQSVGGGGGLAGSADTIPNSGVIALGGTYTEKGGLARDGGAVTVNEGANGDSQIDTYGDAADAILLQSIGGGGGAAGNGATVSGGVLGDGGPDDGGLSGTLQLKDGGTGSSGNGGTVQVDNAYLVLSTTGDNASGIVAQSIGGGGGVVAVMASDATQNPNQTQAVYQLGGQNTAGADGGAVTILATTEPFSAVTTGAGSDGILAQSIGGGGGIDGYASGATTLNTAPAAGTGITNGSGGNVSIKLGKSSVISTTGASADGIFAQSIGGGGGIMPSADGTQLIAGSTGAAGSTGSGGSVMVSQAGTVSATGLNSIGIFVQSTGADGSGTDPYSTAAVSVSGSVEGGSGSDGYGVYLDSNASSNLVQVTTTGSLGSQAGKAVFATGNGSTDIDNAGSTDGSIYAGSVDPGALVLVTNEKTGTLISHGTYQASVINNGLLETDFAGTLVDTRITQNFTQGTAGLYQARIDLGNSTGEVLEVDGAAVLSGHVAPVLIGDTDASGVDRPVTILTADGGLTGPTAATPELLGVDSVVATYHATATGNREQLTLAAVDLNSPAANLTVNQSDFAAHLQEIFAKGRTAFSPLFTQLLNAAAQNPAAYKAQISGMTGDASLGNGARIAADLQSFGDALMSCPAFAGNSGVLREGSCVWARGIDRNVNETSYTGDPGFSLQESGMQIGGQKEITPGWFVGGAAAYGQAWLRGNNDSGKSHGNFGNAGVALKHEAGNWLFAAAAFGSYGQYDATRFLTVANYQATATSTPSTAGADLRLRVAYTAAFGNTYLRPGLSLDGIYAVAPGYKETNGGLLAIAYHTSRQGMFAGTPALEAGERIDLPHENTLRLYGSAGVSLLSSSRWEQQGRFEAEPVNAGNLSSSLPLDTATGRFQAGAQLTGRNAWSLRLEYDGEVSQHVTSHGGILVASMPF